MKALFKSINLIGDALYVGPALRAWIMKNKPVDIHLWTLKDHVAPLYEGMVRDLMCERCIFRTCYGQPNGIEFDFIHTFDVNAAFKLSDMKKQHLATSYAELLGVNIGDEKEDIKPIYIPEYTADAHFDSDALRGCILVSMFSASCTSRDPKCNYIPNKMLPWDKWVPMIEFLRKQFPNTPIRFLGAPTDTIPRDLWEIKDFGPPIPMFGIPLNRLALIMQKAKLLVTIDNGMSHLGASQETPTFLMYPVALGAHYILPIGNPNLVWVHMNPVTVDQDRMLEGLKYAVRKFEKGVWRK